MCRVELVVTSTSSFGKPGGSAGPVACRVVPAASAPHRVEPVPDATSGTWPHTPADSNTEPGPSNRYEPACESVVVRMLPSSDLVACGPCTMPPFKGRHNDTQGRQFEDVLHRMPTLGWRIKNVVSTWRTAILNGSVIRGLFLRGSDIFAPSRIIRACPIRPVTT